MNSSFLVTFFPWRKTSNGLGRRHVELEDRDVGGEFVHLKEKKAQIIPNPWGNPQIPEIPRWEIPEKSRWQKSKDFPRNCWEKKSCFWTSLKIVLERT